MEAELARKYWELANAIVAFSVLQMLAFLYALAGKEFRQQVEQHYRWVQAALLVGSLVYHRRRRLLPDGIGSAWYFDRCDCEANPYVHPLRQNWYHPSLCSTRGRHLDSRSALERKGETLDRQAHSQARINSASCWPR